MDQERRDFLQDSARLGGFALASAALWRIEPVLAQSGPGHELATMTIVELSQLLASRKVTSRQLVEQALVAIKDPQGEGSRTFRNWRRPTRPYKARSAAGWSSQAPPRPCSRASRFLECRHS
jgi:hypothetical protein